MTRISTPGPEAEKSYRWNFVILAIDSAAFGFLRSFLSPYVVMPLFLARMHAPTPAVAMLPVLFVLGFYTCQAVLMGYTKSLARKKRLLIALNALQRAGVVGLYAASRFLSLSPACSVGQGIGQGGWRGGGGVCAVLLAYCVYTVAGGLLTPAWAEVVSASIYRNRGRFFSTARLIGGVLTLTLGAYLSRLLGGIASRQGLVTLFGTLALFGFATLPFAGLFKEVESPCSSEEPTRRGPSIADATRQVVRDRRFRRYLIARCIQIVAEAGHPLVTVYVSGAFLGLGTRMGAMNNVYMAAEIAGSIAAGWLGDRFGYRAALIASSLAGGGAMSLVGLAFGDTYVPLVFALLGIAISMSVTGAIGITMEYSPSRSASLYFGASNLVLSPLLVCAPVIGSTIAAKASFPTLFRLCIGAYAVACCLLLGLSNPDRNAGTASRSGLEPSRSRPGWHESHL